MIVAILTFYYKKTCQNITDTLSCSPIKQEYPQMLQHLRVFGFPVFNLVYNFLIGLVTNAPYKDSFKKYSLDTPNI